jgi:hypothetical protein
MMLIEMYRCMYQLLACMWVLLGLLAYGDSCGCGFLASRPLHCNIPGRSAAAAAAAAASLLAASY